jgi:predicted DNA-binding protein (MmcQ/YjbR family)
MRLACWRARSRDRELSSGSLPAKMAAPKERSFQRDDETSTRDACTTQARTARRCRSRPATIPARNLGNYPQHQMNLEQFREHCLGKPGATESTPFGEDVLVFKVAGKIFALAPLDEVPATTSLKCDPDLALELRDRYEQVRPGYHMNKRHWNTVELDSGIPDTELRKMIDHSYELVFKSLPKARRAELSGK